MRSKWLLLSVAAVIAGVAGSALSLRRKAPPAPAAPTRAAILNDSEVKLTGVVRPQHVTSVGATVEGNIEAFLVDVGEDVFRGQVLARVGAAGLESARQEATLAVERAQDAVTKADAAVNSARLESSRADADLQRSRLQLDRAQKTLERQNLLHSNGATPRLVYEKAVQEYEAAAKEFDIMDKASRGAREGVQTALAQAAAARKMLADKGEELQQAEGAFAAAEVRSPVDGTVVGRKGEVGKPAQELGDQMFQIATDLYALEVVLEPDAAALKRLHPGRPVFVWVLDTQSAPIPAEIQEIRDTEAIVDFNSTSPAIRPGMRADVRIKPE